jgi:hypothetical protein
MENLIYFIIGGFVLYLIFRKGDTTNEDSPNTEGRKISSKDYATLEEGILNPETFLSFNGEELPEGHDDISIVISADLREMIFKMTEYAGTDEYLLSEDEDGKLWIKKTRHISYPEKILDYRDGQTERVWETNPTTSELSFTPEEYKKKRFLENLFFDDLFLVKYGGFNNAHKTGEIDCEEFKEFKKSFSPDDLDDDKRKEFDESIECAGKWIRISHPYLMLGIFDYFVANWLRDCRSYYHNIGQVWIPPVKHEIGLKNIYKKDGSNPIL